MVLVPCCWGEGGVNRREGLGLMQILIGLGRGLLLLELTLLLWYVLRTFEEVLNVKAP